MQIYVGNLPLNSSDEQLRELFEPYGKVKAATVGRDKKSGESLGYGFVEMPVKSEARAAVEALRAKKLQGNPLRARILKPEDEFHQHALALHRGSQPGVKTPAKSFRGEVSHRASGAIRRSGRRGG
jgi:RNA recognition motif-containing protein